MAGVVAAGHPESAAAGATALREGGNAVDAAVGAVLASFAVESPLTGFGAGGYMIVHDQGETTLLDFFVAAPGLDGTRRTAELAPVTVVFDATTSQTFYFGPVSCAVPGTPAGLVEALRRFGSMPLAELAAPAIRLAREGSPVNHQQAYILEILEPIHARLPGTRELYAPEGRTLREGETFRFEELAVALERFAAEGVVPFYRGEVAAALSDFVIDGGGTLGRGDLAAYAAIERDPVHAAFRGTEVLTNPRPSAGGT
ncbi:MAG TPA: gamma-glutamyltransferase, partial [Solirubrobacterales bacterium]|nr:gamma-glutamyltransferase [Solirubrobacterales bacterium]